MSSKSPVCVSIIDSPVLKNKEKKPFQLLTQCVHQSKPMVISEKKNGHTFSRLILHCHLPKFIRASDSVR